ncbi:MAG: hypothetical protein E5W86_15470, partial [Mesorhizobium sp.]
MIRAFLRHAGLAPVLLLALLPTKVFAGSCPEDCSEPPPVDIYSHTAAGDLSPATAGALPRVYV